MPLTDTSPAATEAYFRRLAEMTPEERLNLGMALWISGDSMQRAVLRMDYPDASENEVLLRLAVTRFGDELARKAYGRL